MVYAALGPETQYFLRFRDGDTCWSLWSDARLKQKRVCDWPLCCCERVVGVDATFMSSHIVGRNLASTSWSPEYIYIYTHFFFKDTVSYIAGAAGFQPSIAWVNNWPLSKLLELLDTQVFSRSVQWVLWEITWIWLSTNSIIQPDSEQCSNALWFVLCR